ncbi:hypothetical protein G6F23_013137 [Rhizopus arrhizus]|nr:hypothetical protein G6F23_013137 [Rhizopus arrhizus]
MVARRVSLTQLSTFHDRQGDQDLLRRDGARLSSWARGFGGSFKQPLDGDAQPAFDGDLTGLQVGQDLYTHTNASNTQDRLGLFAGYTHARGDVAGSVSGVSGAGAGRLTVDGYSLGGYWTRVGAAGCATKRQHQRLDVHGLCRDRHAVPRVAELEPGTAGTAPVPTHAGG